MKLAIKLVAILVIELVFILSLDGYLSVQREIRLFDSEMKQKALLIGHAMKYLILDVWRTNGQARAMKLIRDVNEEEHVVETRWVWLDASADDPYAPRIPRERLDRVEHGLEMSFKEQGKTGAGHRFTYIPIINIEDRQGALELSESLMPLQRYSRATVIRIIVLLVVLIAVSVGLALLAGIAMVGRPLGRIMEKVRRIGTGDLSEPLYLRNRDEFTELSQALNRMSELLADSQESVRQQSEKRIEALEQLRHADRLATVGRLASGIAHEVGTPLNVVSGRAGLIVSKSLSEEEIVESASIIKEQSERIAMIIRQLLDFARRRPLRKTPTDLKKIVGQTLNILSPLCKKYKATPILSGQTEPAVALVDAGQIQQVMTNLILNAIQAMPRGGKVEVGIREEQRASATHSRANYFCIYVLDEGEGISDENRHQIFDPFFSTKDVGAGTGLGLSIARGIIEDHNGWIEVKSKPGQGSCFEVYLLQEVDK